MLTFFSHKIVLLITSGQFAFVNTANLVVVIANKKNEVSSSKLAAHFVKQISFFCEITFIVFAKLNFFGVLF